MLSYPRLINNLNRVKASLSRPSPLSLAQKILYAHLDNPNLNLNNNTYLKLKPDRVAMQDASAQMALLQFIVSGLEKTAVPASIHCDHLIQANLGAKSDVRTAETENKEVFDFLKSAAEKYGIAFWRPGSGIIHQIVLENYAAPGMLMLGTDSHTPNAGGLGGLAVGVGGADAVDAMADIPWELKTPKVIGVRLDGQLKGWASPKDIILKLAGELTVRGGTGHIIEYFGPGAATLSCTGMATICNMGAEVGATTSVFPYSARMRNYLVATRRENVATAADKALAQGYLLADPECSATPEKYYDRVIHMDLNKIEPALNGPFTPDLHKPLQTFKQKTASVTGNSSTSSTPTTPTSISVALIGSCTNSSYQDFERAASIAKQAVDAGVPLKVPLLVTPGSEQIRATVERDGLTEIFEKAGATVLANACGPCIGMWKRKGTKPTSTSAKSGSDDTTNAIVSSFNRNFRGRNDGNPNTQHFLGSPEIVTALAFSGRLDFNPATDAIKLENGSEFRFQAPPVGSEVPQRGFHMGDITYQPPSDLLPNSKSLITVSPTSTRLQLLEPFPPYPTHSELCNLRILLKVRGKCTTDHISAAGPWLKYKGHLENISENTLIGALDDDVGIVNRCRDSATGEICEIPEVAKRWRERGVSWCVVADDNYGEGSAREHAAMQIRYLGGQMILCRSFARIHETNLKKQGVIPLTFCNPADYDRLKDAAGLVLERSEGLSSELLTAGAAKGVGGDVKLFFRRAEVFDGSKNNGNEGMNVGDLIEIRARHTLSQDQVEWIRAGSALNWIRTMLDERKEGTAKSVEREVEI